MRTKILDRLAFFKSAWTRSGPYYVEPQEPSSTLLAKRILIRHPVFGNSLLVVCPDLTEDGLASSIETKLRNSSGASFATPYIALPQTMNPESGELEIYAYPPLTRMPFLAYVAGQRVCDFSKMVFEAQALIPFLNAKYDFNFLIPAPCEQATAQEESPKIKYSRENWQESIKNCTTLLNDFYDGTVTPMTYDQTKDFLDNRGICLNEPFKAWWSCVPDKFKAGAKHSFKKPNNISG